MSTTSTLPPPATPPQGAGLASAQPTRSERRREANAAHDSGVERTLRATLATALGVLPLAALFSDIRWLADVLAAIGIVGGTAALLRYWLRPRVWHTWLGVLLLVPWLTWRFVPGGAIGHVIPSETTSSAVSHLLNQVHNTTSNGVAPVPSSHALTLVLAALCGLLAALVDLVAVVGRRPALAGVPLLVVFTVAGAVRRHPVSWVWFGATAIGFLLLLSIDARDEVRRWGRIIPRAGEARPTAALAVSGPRIAVIALAVAVLLPLVVPARTSNLLANAFHNGNAGTGGKGTIGAGGVSLNPFAALKGDLVQAKPTNLFTVTVDGGTPVAPYYLRANVLANYTPNGWSATAHHGQRLADSDFQTNPPAPNLKSAQYVAHLVISGLSDNPPVFANPSAVGGVDPDSTGWDSDDQLLIGPRVKKHQVIDETVVQPAPTVADLQNASGPIPASIVGNYLLGTDGTTGIPTKVVQIVDQLTRNKTTEYAKAKAINDYFSVQNGFTYSLQTPAGDSGSALLDFLTNQTGFCQQFAAAMGIMLRIAGIPARVVLGYTHAPLNDNGAFTVTTANAHAWVEAYFPGLGWIPFDPTPITPSAGAATADVPWAPHPSVAANPHDTLPAVKGSASTAGAKPQVGDGAAGSSATGSAAHAMPWAMLVTVLVLLLLAAVATTPAAARQLRRRRRLRSAAHGDPDPLWTELSDTALDLGYVWSAARTPRQVVGWLAGDVGPHAAQSLRELAAAVEQARYAPSGADQATRSRTALVGDLKDVESQLRARRSRSTRIRSWLLPASLRWVPRRRRSKPRRR